MDGLSAPVALARDLPQSAVAPHHHAVFLHTGWRTAGTWIWARLREQPDAMGFYEPLHERLASLRFGDMASLRAEDWRSGHPALAAPYFHEFGELIDPARGCVAGFQASFAQDRFFTDPQAEMPALAEYLHGLIDHAASQRRRAVLKFCRSLGRAAWMMRQFPRALHVAVVTTPLMQAQSARRQMRLHGNPFFVARPFAVLAHNAGVPRVGAILEQLRVTLPGRPEDAADHVAGLDDEACYRGLLAFWLLGMLSLPDDLHLVIDTALLPLSAAYRREVERQIAEATGWPISLDDPRPVAFSRPGDDFTGLSARARLHCHRDAQDVLLQHGDAGSRLWSRVNALLSFADLAPVDATPPQAAPAPGWGEMFANTARLRLQLDQVRAALAETEERCARYAAEIAAFQASTSWAVTAPLRQVGERLKRTLRPTASSPQGGGSL